MISASPVVGLSRLFPSNVLLEATLEGVSRFDGFGSSSAIMLADVGGLNPYTLCHPILERLRMSLISARWITQVRLAPSAGVLRFDGPALVSLPFYCWSRRWSFISMGFSTRGSLGFNTKGNLRLCNMRWRLALCWGFLVEVMANSYWIS